MSSLKERARAARDLRREAVDVPEWGGGVWVRMLSGLEVIRLQEWAQAQEAAVPDAVRRGVAQLVRIVVLCVVDETGAQAFDEADESWLVGKSQEVLQRVVDVALRLSRLGKAPEGNSAGAGGSATASPSPSANGTSMPCSTP